MSDTRERQERGIEVSLEVEGLPEGTLVVAELSGTEAISKLFEFRVLVLLREGALDTDAIVGTRCTIVWRRGTEEVRRLAGLVRMALDRLDTETQQNAYWLTIAPRAYAMALHETLDIFLDLTVPEIAEKLFALASLSVGADYELRLYETYPKREFVVQYKETDLAFMSRWLEHYGISFFFEHRDGNEVVVLTDRNEGFRPAVGHDQVTFRPRGERRDVFQLETENKMVPSRVLVRDYNYRTPKVDLFAEASNDAGSGGLVVAYGDHFKTTDEAAKIAKVRLQETMSRRRVFRGESDLPNLAAGACFRLGDHPWGDMDLLVTEVDHHVVQASLLHGKSGPTYHNTFRAVGRNVAFRPERATPKPKVHGVLTGVVDADSPGQYAELDDEGRYRVKFLYDTRDAAGKQASRPLRMMQPHAGQGYGMHFPLRPGVEVLITCVDGDPDRPIIAGAVPNPQTASPVAAKIAPRNIIRTGGNNEINIDDTEDSERIKLMTPRRGTQLQLGAPNDPIDGISLKTEGHTSNAAVEGSSQWSTFGMQMSAFVNLLKSGTVVNVASPPTLLGLAAVGTSIWQGMVSGGLPFAKDIYKHNKSAVEEKRNNLLKGEAAKNQEAIEASTRARNKKEECNACRTKAKALLPTKPTLSDPVQPGEQARLDEYNAIMAALAGLDQATTDCDTAFLTAIGTMEDRNGIVDANRTNFLNDNFDPVMQRDAMSAVSTYDVAKFEAVMAASDAARWNALLNTDARSKQAWLALTQAQREAYSSSPGKDQWIAAEKARLDAQMTNLDQQTWLDEEKKKWIYSPPPDSDVDYYKASAWTALDKTTIPASIFSAAGVSGTSYALLSDADKALVEQAWKDAEKVDGKKVRDRRWADMEGLLTAALAGKNPPLQPPYSNYQAFQAAMAACKTSCVAQLDADRTAAISKNDELANLMRDNTDDLYTLQQLSNNNEQAYANWTSFGINLLLSIFAFIEMFTARVSLRDRWKGASEIADTATADMGKADIDDVVNPLKAKIIKGALPIPFLQHRTNVLGSEDSTEVFGKNDILVWSKTAVILGMGSQDRWLGKKGGAAAVAGVVGLPLPSDKPKLDEGKVLIAAAETVRVLAGTEFHVLGKDKADVYSRTEAGIRVTNQGNINESAWLNLKKKELYAEVRADDGNIVGALLEMKVVDADGNGQVKLNTAGGQILEMKQEPKTTALKAGANDSLVLNAEEHTATLLASTWRLHMKTGDDQGVLLGREDGWALKIKQNELIAGLADGPHLKVTNAHTDLKAAQNLVLTAPGELQFATPKVVFGPAVVESDNLLVKGGPNPQVVALQQNMTAAIQRAAQAAQEADARAQSAMRAAEAAMREAQIARYKAVLAALANDGDA